MNINTAFKAEQWEMKRRWKLMLGWHPSVIQTVYVSSQFLGGMYAEAFLDDDFERIITAGLRCIISKEI
jgi:hypothetical protein